MNPCAALLVLLSLAGLWLRRGGAGRAWVVCGLAGIALLAPALALPDGVPSPAASLAHDPPWLGVANPAAGNDNLRDVTYQVEPWLLFLRHELRAGRLPFWDPYQAAGCPFWSNGSSAPLFPLHLLFAVLPLQLGFVLLPWLRLVVAGCGAWALAVELGLSRQPALLAAVAYPLSGTVTSFLLFPMSNAHALLPWVFVTVERLAAGKAGIAPLALLGGLQLLGGHPETALYTALLSAVYLVVRGSRRPVFAWSGLGAGWALAGAIAAVELLPLALFLPETSRWLAWRPAEPVPLATVAGLLLRLVLPDLYGNPSRGTWWGPYNFAATAIYVGALAPVLAAGALGAVRRDRRWLGVAAVTLFAICAAYQLPGARQLMEALPLVRRGLYHYIKLGLELGLALLAAAGLESWLAGRRRALLAGAVALLATLAAAWARFGADWNSRGLIPAEARWTAWAVGLTLLASAALWLPPEWRRRSCPLLLGLFAVDLVAAHAATNPGLSLARLFPRSAAVRFLQDKPGRVSGTGGALHPNAGMVYGLYDVRGDDSVKLERYEELYAAHLGQGHPTFFLPMNRWQDHWLDRLGVRWVLTGPQDAPPVGNWRLAYAGPDARVFERPHALPLAHWLRPDPGGAPPPIVERRVAGDWAISWRSAIPATLEVSEVWDRGWRAELDGRAAPVEIVDKTLLGVRVGPGAGTLRLSYVPAGFAWGALATVLGLGATLIAHRFGPWSRPLRQRRRECVRNAG
jgi:hypothetical protein